LIANRGRSMTPAMLAPRHPDQLPGAGSAAATAGLAAFHGTYQGEFSDGTASLPINTVLRRNGDQVAGEYYYGPGAGQVCRLDPGRNLLFPMAGRRRDRIRLSGNRGRRRDGVGPMGPQ
jgi:hypothetical protein